MKITKRFHANPPDLYQVCVSLATYTLFLLDARRQSFWEKLDDYLYYVRAFGNSVEFSFGILLFINGAWILVFESGKSRNAAMPCPRQITFKHSIQKKISNFHCQ